MHIYKSRFLTRGEVWYDHEPGPGAVDWIMYRQRSQPVPGARWKHFYTRVVDLSQTAKALQHQMSKSTAYKVRRARDKDGVVCECVAPLGSEMLDRFEHAYRAFAALKGLPPLDRPLLDGLDESGFLEMSVAKDQADQPLAYHTYYRDSHRSCLLHAVSLYQALADSGVRNALGRANRYLFWCDILRHQERRLKLFDFGGWYPGDTDQALLDINQFKEGFGGKVMREYNCEQILSAKAWVVLRGAALVARLKRRPTKRLSGPCSAESETNLQAGTPEPANERSLEEIPSRLPPFNPPHPNPLPMEEGATYTGSGAFRERSTGGGPSGGTPSPVGRGLG